MLSLLRSLNGYSIVQIHIRQTFRIWTWLSYYLVGGILGKEETRKYILKNISCKINFIIFIIMTFIAEIYQYNIAKYFYNDFHAEYFYDNIFMFIWILSLFILIYRQNYYNTKFKPIIEFISDNSIGVYILHVSVIKVLLHFYKFDTPITNICLIIMVFVGTIIIAAIMKKLPLANRLLKI